MFIAEIHGKLGSAASNVSHPLRRPDEGQPIAGGDQGAAGRCRNVVRRANLCMGNRLAAAGLDFP
jgi:hypothetical protein